MYHFIIFTILKLHSKEASLSTKQILRLSEKAQQWSLCVELSLE